MKLCGVQLIVLRLDVAVFRASMTDSEIKLNGGNGVGVNLRRVSFLFSEERPLCLLSQESSLTTAARSLFCQNRHDSYGSSLSSNPRSPERSGSGATGHGPF